MRADVWLVRTHSTGCDAAAHRVPCGCRFRVRCATVKDINAYIPAADSSKTLTVTSPIAHASVRQADRTSVYSSASEPTPCDCATLDRFQRRCAGSDR